MNTVGWMSYSTNRSECKVQSLLRIDCCVFHAACVFLAIPVYIDDTGCPSSESVSPSKTLSGSDNSPQGSPTPTAECKTKVKRVRVMAEWHAPPPRHKREQRSSTLPRGRPLQRMASGLFLYVGLGGSYIL